MAAHLSHNIYPTNPEPEFSNPETAQQNFQNQYDLDNPLEAINSYARTMHQHTKLQLENLTRSRPTVSQQRRRSPTSSQETKTKSNLNTETSIESVNSTAS